jgi:hypothetical protein
VEGDRHGRGQFNQTLGPGYVDVTVSGEQPDYYTVHAEFFTDLDMRGGFLVKASFTA